MFPMPHTGVAHRIVLYSDFNCPFCYALHERLHDYGALERVEWRGVQHAPHLPIPMARWNGPLLGELRQEVAMVNRLAPMLPIVLPPGKPNTGPAIRLAARALTTDSARGNELVRRLYWLFWRESRDISDEAVLSETLSSIGLKEPTLLEQDSETALVMEGWTNQWHNTGQAGVPLLERPDGALLVGLSQEAHLRRFLSES
jgi:predicted DsbA family dithiol-disulfide isomerase